MLFDLYRMLAAVLTALRAVGIVEHLVVIEEIVPFIRSGFDTQRHRSKIGYISAKASRATLRGMVRSGSRSQNHGEDIVRKPHR